MAREVSSKRSAKNKCFVTWCNFVRIAVIAGGFKFLHTSMSTSIAMIATVGVTTAALERRLRSGTLLVMPKLCYDWSNKCKTMTSPCYIVSMSTAEANPGRLWTLDTLTWMSMVEDQI